MRDKMLIETETELWYNYLKDVKGNLTMKVLCRYLAEARDKFELFKLSEATYVCNVTEQTVRNFEKGSCVNPLVMLYYINRVRNVFSKMSYEESHVEVNEFLTANAYFSLSTLEYIIEDVLNINKEKR